MGDRIEDCADRNDVLLRSLADARDRLSGLEECRKHDLAEYMKPLNALERRILALEKRDKAERIFNFVAKDYVVGLGPAPSPTCGSCRWYSGGGENPTYDGVCQRFPPLAQPFDSVRAEHGRALFPRVNRDCSCGEHAPR